ncbi:hypothetical protein BGZ46_006369 [Entomortierella lignicola]|nr:hypothetical protein BGZ46_006369 [Entomortierella lignicola]
MQIPDKDRIHSMDPPQSSQFALLLSNWLKDHRTTKDAETQPQFTNNSITNLNSSSNTNTTTTTATTNEQSQHVPSWVFAPLPQSNSHLSILDSSNSSSDVSLLLPKFENLTTADVATIPDIQHQQTYTSQASASFKRSQAKYKQPWRRTRPDMIPRKATSKRSSSTSESTADTSKPVERSSNLYLPHDILLAIFSHLPARAYAHQYYDRVQPSDLLACSRVNMAWRIAALSTIWQAIVLPDPIDKSCKSLLHLLASSHASAQITGKNYDITEIIQRVEVDILEAGELLAEARDFEVEHPSPSANTDMATMTDYVTTLLEYVSPFRTLSIQLPQEIESNAAQALAKDTSIPMFEAIIRGIQGAKVNELDMPSPMYCSVSTFPGMLNLIQNLQDLRVLILGYSSRDWPLLKAIISLPHLENLCVFDSCWSNQIWIYLISSLGSRLRGLTALQGRRPLEGSILREGIAPFCKNLTTFSVPFIQLMSGPGPVLKDADVIPVIKACQGLQNINISGQRLLGDAVLEAIADLWSLQILDIRDCSLLTGLTIKGVRWQSIQRVRMSGCGEISQEFMELVLQAWRSTTVNPSRHVAGSGFIQPIMRFSSVFDFNGDVEDPVEMGWVRQREDEPPLALDEDHFFADWYV